MSRVLTLVLLFFIPTLNAFQQSSSLELSETEKAWLQQHPEIRFVGDPNWLPFEAYDEQGNYIGIVAEHLKIIESQIGQTLQKIPTKTWLESVSLIKNGQADVLAVTDNAALGIPLLFSRSYVSNPLVIVMSSRQHYVEGLAAIKDRSIGVVKGYGYVERLMLQHPDYNFELINNIEDGLLAVSTGKVDALLCTVTLCGYNIKKMALQDVQIVGKTNYNADLVFAVRSDYQPLVGILNKAINNISEENQQKILDNWSLEGYVVKTDYTLVWQLLLAFSAVVAFSTYRQQQLSRYNKALAQSDARYARAVRGTSDGIWDWNVSDNTYYLSPRFKALLGYEEQELSVSVDDFLKFIHPEDSIRVAEKLQAHFKGINSFDEEFRLKTKQGRYRWYRSAGQAEFNDSGRAIKMAGALSDINRRKRIESLEKSRNRVLELTARGESLQKVLRAIIDSIESEQTDMMCSILLVSSDGKALHYAAAPKLPDFFVSAGEGLPVQDSNGSCGTAVFRKQRIIVSDIQTHPFWSQYTEIAAQAKLAACWSEPIFDVQRNVIGTFAIYHSVIRSPSEHDIMLIEQAATLAGIAIEKHRATEELKLASLVYQNSSEAMLIFDSERKIIGVNPAFSEITGYSAEEVLGSDANSLNSDFHEQSFYDDMRNAVEKTGYWQGEIRDQRKNGEYYTKWMIVNTIFHKDGSVDRRLSLFSDITQKKESEALIWKQANFDFLTGLPNRSMFHERLDREIQRAKREKTNFAVLLIDLDEFKEVNDSLGHDKGDQLLLEVSNRITDSIRESDTVARLGGDEFTIILSEIEDPAKVERVAQVVNERLAEPFMLANEMVYISASIGITLYPNDSDNFESLLKNADQAMYEAKNLGKNRYQYFTRSMQQAALIRMRMIADLKLALQQKQFHLVYQPIIDLSDGKIRKAEALLRWQHPDKGLINPDEFIPLAEDTGMIVEIGAWVLAEASLCVAEWRQQFDSKFQISVNTSPIQYQENNNQLASWLQHSEATASAGDGIVMEITEGLMMDASDNVSKQLLAFKNAGIQVALDDFGTGYSSLSYLKRFDIDYIKIDRAFVQNLNEDENDRALCEAIVVMAHKLKLKVIAEGVETESQKLILQKMGCDYAQGYLFAKPLDKISIEKMIQEKVEA